jgi:hypothetical protein
VKYGVEWLPGTALVAAVLILPLAPPFALIAVALLALAAVAAVVALAAALLASPYLVVRVVRRHLEERDMSTESPGPHPVPAPKSVVA